MLRKTSKKDLRKHLDPFLEVQVELLSLIVILSSMLTPVHKIEYYAKGIISMQNFIAQPTAP